MVIRVTFIYDGAPDRVFECPLTALQRFIERHIRLYGRPREIEVET